MANVIVAFSKPEDARTIRKILIKNGFCVTAVCTSGAQALNHMEDLSGGILVCGYRLTDMLFSEIAEDMSPEFFMLMISSPVRWPAHKPENVMFLAMPLKAHDLVESLEMISEMQARRRRVQRQRPKQRTEKDKAVIYEAKTLLMERNGMTEDEAYRYIQKSSMDSGSSMAETAQMVIRLIHM